jgi:hypothetical protein
VARLADRAKPGRGNDLPLETVGKVLSAVMSSPPKAHSHWSTGLLARKFGMSKTSAHKVLRDNDVKPHQHRTFKISRDPRFDEKVVDLVGCT